MLSIKNWDKRFETHRTREMKKLDWVPIPTSMDDDGYVQIMDHPDGTAHYACWIAIVSISARAPAASLRGKLVKSDGETPHDIASLSRISRIHDSFMETAVQRFIHELHWLEQDCESENIEVTENRGFSAQIPRNPAPRARTIGREKKGIETTRPLTPTGGSAAVVDPLAFCFEDFWALWPPVRKQAKAKALELWKRHGCDALGDVIREAVLRQKKSGQWQRGFIPMPTTWLNAKRWEDDPEAGNLSVPDPEIQPPPDPDQQRRIQAAIAAPRR